LWIASRQPLLQEAKITVSATCILISGFAVPAPGNKSIGGDTKAATRQSPNFIKITKKLNMAKTADGIITLHPST